jgi:hypothetical protein
MTGSCWALLSREAEVAASISEIQSCRIITGLLPRASKSTESKCLSSGRSIDGSVQRRSSHSRMILCCFSSVRPTAPL